MTKKNIKILMVSSSSKLGGGPKLMFSLGESLADNFDFFYALPDSKNFSNYLKNGNYIFIKEREINLKDILKMVKFIKKNKIDLIHAHGKGASAISRIIKIFIRKPIIYTFHGIHLSCHSLLSKILYLIYEYSTGFLDFSKVFVSRSELKFAKKFRICMGRKAVIINNGIKNRGLKSENISKEKKVINNCIDKTKIISVCRFVEQKNIKEIIQIAQILHQFNFKIIGDGPLYSEIDNLIKIKCLNNVQLLGNCNNVYEHLFNSDIFLSSSLYEGLPLSILEAMSIGLPIVASNVVGNCDTIIHDHSGYLYELHDIYSAVRYLKMLSNDKEDSLKKGMAALNRQRENFSIKKMKNSYKELYTNAFAISN